MTRSCPRSQVLYARLRPIRTPGGTRTLTVGDFKSPASASWATGARPQYAGRAGFAGCVTISSHPAPVVAGNLAAGAFAYAWGQSPRPGAGRGTQCFEERTHMAGGNPVFDRLNKQIEKERLLAA